MVCTIAEDSFKDFMLINPLIEVIFVSLSVIKKKKKHLSKNVLSVLLFEFSFLSASLSLDFSPYILHQILNVDR